MSAIIYRCGTDNEEGRAREIDPASLLTNAIEGQILFFAGDRRASKDILKRTVELDQRFWLAYLFLTRVYTAKGRWVEAISAGRRAAELSGGNAEAKATTAYSLARSGRTTEARQILAELIERSKDRFVPRNAIAQIHFALVDRDAAFANLQAALEGREALMTFLKIEPKWDSLRAEPRFIELMRRMNPPIKRGFAVRRDANPRFCFAFYSKRTAEPVLQVVIETVPSGATNSPVPVQVNSYPLSIS